MIYRNAAYLYLMCTLVRIKFKRLQQYLGNFKYDLKIGLNV